MDIELLLNDLNDAQRQAVTSPTSQAVLVLAGAGSGKTRVLTRRIAWVLATENLSPDRILAVTFTNKAAKEMRDRVETLIGLPMNNLWLGTFHGISHRILRRHAVAAGLRSGFQILDANDQAQLLRRIIKDLEYDEKRWRPRQIATLIHRAKDEGRNLEEIQEFSTEREARAIHYILAAYRDACERSNLVDFSDLLVRVTQLMQSHPEISSNYQSLFRHILVDEFQDTNTIQYQWLRAIAGAQLHPFVVGDDDQSIYGWRGARAENVRRFQHDYAPVTLVRLEQNYRSTRTILAAANSVISKNKQRLGKTLWTARNQGMPIELYGAADERDEAAHVVGRIQRWVVNGGNTGEAAILYRSNAQSRLFEELLIAHKIPYQVYGGLRFFERAEIKDALAYLRLLVSQDDDTAFERIINQPPRGIGSRTLQSIRVHAAQKQTSLWTSAVQLSEHGDSITGRPATALRNFLSLIRDLVNIVETHLPEGTGDGNQLAVTIEEVISSSGLATYHGQSGDEQAQSRLENLTELVSAASSYTGEPGIPILTSFLSQAALEAGETQAGSTDRAVKLMSLHAAKGLEFPLVLITGLEEGLFPHQKSIETPIGLEEERRLFYVGLTRACSQLVLCYAEQRRLHGQSRYTRPSRFLSELPEDVVHQEGTRRLSVTQVEPTGLGKRVRHHSFGEGVVIDQEGEGPRLRIKVAFENGGTKWLVAAFAKLTILD